MQANSTGMVSIYKELSFNPHFRSDSYEDELIWAAAWLYKATLDSKYLVQAEDLYAKRYYINMQGMYALCRVLLAFQDTDMDFLVI